MTPEQAGRVEGEFHYGSLEPDSRGHDMWVVRRNDDAFCELVGSFTPADTGPGIVRARLQFWDQHARHFIQQERQRMIGDLENAATDCDGHTPYSILMALAEEARAEGA